MVDDIRLAIDMDHNPKVLRLEKELGPGATWALVRLWLYTARHRPDGVLTGIGLNEIEPLVGWKRRRGRLIAALERLRFIEVNDTGTSREVTIHEWGVHQPWVSGAKRRSEVARENVSKRWAKKPAEKPETLEKDQGAPTDRNTGGSTDGNTGGNSKSILLAFPSPTPSPNPSPSLASVSRDLPSAPGRAGASSQDQIVPRPDVARQLGALLDTIGKVEEPVLKSKGNGKLVGEGKGDKTPRQEFLDSLDEDDQAALTLAVDQIKLGKPVSVALDCLESAGWSVERMETARALFLAGARR